MVTRHILEQTRRNGDDLAAVKTRLDSVERKVDGLETKVDSLAAKLDGLAAKADGLIRSLPQIVGCRARSSGWSSRTDLSAAHGRRPV
jgi:hypothetical protein